MERPCAWKKYTPEQLVELEKICSGYKEFISENKTERLCVRTGAALAEQAGYVELGQAVDAGKTLKPGDKVYAVNHGKTLMLMQIGKRRKDSISWARTWTARVSTSSKTPPSRQAIWRTSTRTTTAA